MARAVTKRNPAVSPEQYRLAQSVLHGTVKTPTAMTKKVAKELIKKTPAHLRSKWSKRNKRNPESDSAAMYESFHGTPSTAVDEFEEKEHYHSNLAALGELVGLKVRTVSGYDVMIGFESGKASNPRRRSNIWPFDSFSRTTIYHVPSGHKFHTSTSHKGHTIYKSESKPGYVIPSIERDSVFDSVKDAKKFIDHWTKHRPNPKSKRPHPFQQSRQFVGDVMGVLYKPIDKFVDVADEAVGYGLRKIGGKGKHKGKWKRNPDFSLYDAAMKADENFQKALEKEYGKRAGDMRYRSKEHTPEIRRLAKLKHEADERWLSEMRRKRNPDHVLLCSTEDGENLQLIGGDQSLDLDALKIESNKELIPIGEVWGVNYRTEKVFGDGGSEDGLTEYIHIFGPKETKPPRGGDLWADAVPPKDDTFGTGELPTLVYDKRNQKLLLSGGIYHIDQPLMGTSVGIEN